MDGDGFGGSDSFGGDNYGGGNDSGTSGSANSPPTGQQVGSGGDGGAGGNDGDSSLNPGGPLDLSSLLGPQGFELHAGTHDGGNNPPHVSASGIGVEIEALSGPNGNGSLIYASADDNTLLDANANGPQPDAGIDIGLFNDAPEGDGLVNVASGSDNVVEIGAGEGGLNGLNAASLDVSAEYDPATGTTIGAAVSGGADNPDTVSLGGLISDGESLGAALPVVDMVADVGIG